MSTTPPNEPWGPPPGGGYPPPPPNFPPPGYGPPGGGAPGGGYPGGGYPGGGFPGGNVFEDPTRTPYGQLAGWWRRVGATIVDGLLLGIPTIVITLIVGGGQLVDEGFYQLINIFYTTFLIGGVAAATLGMRAVGTRAVDINNGAPIGTGRAFVRWLVMAVLNVTVIGGLLDIFWPLWDRNNQTLHDKAVRSIVVCNG